MKKTYKKRKIKFRNHTKRRLRERYDVDFNNEDLKKMRDLVLSGETKPIKKFSRTRTLHEIKYKGIKIIVIYNKFYKEIATVIKEETNDYT